MLKKVAVFLPSLLLLLDDDDDGGVFCTRTLQDTVKTTVRVAPFYSFSLATEKTDRAAASHVAVHELGKHVFCFDFLSRYLVLIPFCSAT